MCDHWPDAPRSIARSVETILRPILERSNGVIYQKDNPNQFRGGWVSKSGTGKRYKPMAFVTLRKQDGTVLLGLRVGETSEFLRAGSLASISKPVNKSDAEIGEIILRQTVLPPQIKDWIYQAVKFSMNKYKI